MSSPVQDVVEWSRWLVESEAKGVKDLEKAMHRVADRYGFSFSQLWMYRYRPPKDIAASTYERFAKAYHAEKLRQLRLLQAELATFEAKTFLGARLRDAASDFSREETESLNSGE